MKYSDGDNNEQLLNAYSRLSTMLSTLNMLGDLILIEAHELGVMNSHYLDEESQAQRCQTESTVTQQAFEPRQPDAKV